MATSLPLGNSSVGSTWTRVTPSNRPAVEKQTAEQAQGKASPGKIGAHHATKGIGNSAQAEKTAEVFKSMMKNIGGWGLTGVAGFSYLLKAPVLNMTINRSLISKIRLRSKSVNLSKNTKVSTNSEPGKVTTEEFKRFRRFTGQLVKPSDKLNKWSLNFIKSKDEFFYNQIKDKPTNKFSDEEQAAVDEFHFQGIQGHLNLIKDVGNADNDREASQEIREAHVAEVLAKSLAYLENIDGKTIKIPIRDADGEWKMKEYTVETKMIGDKLPIHVLKPKGEDGKIFVVVRGTELRTSRPGAAESVLADVDPQGIAHSLVKREMEPEGTLRQILDDAGPDKVILVGHSLGGAIVNIAAIRDIDSHEGVKDGKPSHNIHKAYGFSAPGVGNKEAEMARKPTNELEVKNRVVNYQTSGDVVPTVGNSIGTNKEVNLRGAKGFIKEALTNPIDTHFTMGLNQAATVTTTDKFDELASQIPRIISRGLLAGARYGLFKKAEEGGATPSYYMKV